MYYKLAFIITIGGDKKYGSYPHFKLLSDLCLKKRFSLPKITLNEFNLYYSNRFSHGPQRLKAALV